MKSHTFSYQETTSPMDEEQQVVRDNPNVSYTDSVGSGINSKDDLRFRTFIRSSVLRKKPSPEILKAIRNNIQSS